MNSEAAVQAAIRIEAGRLGVYLWRNNSGAYQDERGNFIRYGLANESAKVNRLIKSPDLIGVAPGGLFVAVECKTPGWTRPRNDTEHAQLAFLQIVTNMGGRAGFATSVDDFRRILNCG